MSVKAPGDAGAALITKFATPEAMDALLRPRRIAIVGASPNPGFAHSIQRALLWGGYDGEVLPINPKYTEVLGVPAYPSLDAVDGAIDLAIIVVPNRLTFEMLDACERVGVGAVNLIASGFAETPGDTEGQERQRRIREFALRTGIRIAGPNCLGNISVRNRMNAKSGPYFGPLPSGPIAAVFQSGLLSYSLVSPLVDRAIGFTYVVTSGNEADLETADFIRYFIEDEETRVIGAFVEQFRDPAKLLRVADLAAERGKPIVVLKVGRSEGGRRAALAHTGSLVGSDDIADAVMRQRGIIRVATIDEMLETLAIFHAGTLPRGDGVATVFMSGGAAGLASDLGQDLGLRYPPLADATRATLAEIIPSYGTIDNPLDTTGQLWETPGGMQRAISALAEDPNLDVIVYGRPFPGRMNVSPGGEFPGDLPDRFPEKLFLIMSIAGGRHRDQNYPDEKMETPTDTLDGIPFLQGIENSLRAIRSLLRYAAFQRARGTNAVADPSDDTERVRELIRAAGGRPLVEREAKELLALYGIPITKEHLATTADEAIERANQIGFPVALKVESPDIAHKTEAGGIALGLDSVEAVRDGFEQIMGNARRYAPDATINGALVQEMVPGGREVIVGMTQDPDFGPAVALGVGGVFVETLRDIQIGVPPLTERDAREMLERLRGYPILEGSGARGQAPADLSALIDIILRFSQLCHDLRDDIAEIDINPLVVFEAGQGARVVDCLIVPNGT